MRTSPMPDSQQQSMHAYAKPSSRRPVGTVERGCLPSKVPKTVIETRLQDDGCAERFGHPVCDVGYDPRQMDKKTGADCKNLIHGKEMCTG